MAIVSGSVPGRIRLDRARSFFGRLLGLLGRDRLPPDEALLIERCASIHTLGMRISIDVVFISSQAEVVAVHEGVPPGRLLCCSRARHVIELGSGMAARLGIQPGARLVLGPTTLTVAIP